LLPEIDGMASCHRSSLIEPSNWNLELDMVVMMQCGPVVAEVKS